MASPPGPQEGSTAPTTPKFPWHLPQTGIGGRGPWGSPQSLFGADFTNWMSCEISRLQVATYQLPCIHYKRAELEETDFTNAATLLNSEVAAVRAIAEVESRGSGFLVDGRPKILFERHYFSRLTNRAHDSTHPNISSRSAGGYHGGASEYRRLASALALDVDAALQSASWGAFQVMGANYASLDKALPNNGFSSIRTFVSRMYESEGKHLLAFIAFVKANKLDVHIRAGKAPNFTKFARGYNGKGYRKNQYDTKMQRAYDKYKLQYSVRAEMAADGAAITLNGSVGTGGKNGKRDAMLVQMLLNRWKHGTLTEDGLAGNGTAARIRQFQGEVVKLNRPDGRVDPGGKTFTALVSYI